jgi:hypothetical protein
MLVLTEKAYARATESSPNGNADGGVVPCIGVVGPRVVASHRAVERWNFLSASYPQSSSSYTDSQRGNLRRRLAERRRIGESHRSPQGDDGSCTGLVVVWRLVPDESDGIGAVLPQAGRAHGPHRSGA